MVDATSSTIAHIKKISLLTEFVEKQFKSNSEIMEFYISGMAICIEECLRDGINPIDLKNLIIKHLFNRREF
jgi:hypothetical protein